MFLESSKENNLYILVESDLKRKNNILSLGKEQRLNVGNLSMTAMMYLLLLLPGGYVCGCLYVCQLVSRIKQKLPDRLP